MTGNPGNPKYRQVCQRILADISQGKRQPGTRLPSTRQLARDLGVSRITVATAYRILEADGVIVTRERSGTFVAPPLEQPTGADVIRLPRECPPADWESDLPLSGEPCRDAMLSRVLASFSDPQAIPFSWGAGDPALFPVDEFRVIINRVLRSHGAAAMGGEHSEGNTALRRALATYLNRLGVSVAPDQVIVTTGSQQAISLVADSLLSPGDRVIVESPTWPGALEAFSLRGAKLVEVPVDADGMCVSDLDALLAEHRPRLIYSVPTFHNPTGAVMSPVRRQRLLMLARRHGVPILEDDALREVRFGGVLPIPLAAMDPGGNVINIGSFTKSLLPAARIGYLTGPPGLRESIVARKRWADMFSSPLMQVVLAEYLESGAALRLWKRCNRVYARRQAAMLDALKRHFPRDAQWRRTGGGPQIWVRVPRAVSVRELFAQAVAAGVPFAPGEAFFARPDDQPFLRLNFAVVDEQRIETGIARLGELLQSMVPGSNLQVHRRAGRS